MVVNSVGRTIASAVARAVAGIASGGGGGGEPSYDYLIENDAGWDTVFANDDATLSGKTIAIAPGNYTTKTLANRSPANPITIQAINTLNKPVIDHLEIDGCDNLIFRHIKITTDAWEANNNFSIDGAAVGFYGDSGDIIFRFCDFVGNVEGVVDDPNFDPTVAIASVASILPVFNSSGVIISFDIRNPFIGDLLPDGTYDMIFSNGVVGAEGTFTVSGQNIVSTTLVNGGTSSFNENTGAGIRSRVISWVGQTPPITFGPSGIRGSSIGSIASLTFEDCYFRMFNSCLKTGCPVGGWTIRRCDFVDMYADYMSFGAGPTTAPVEISDNFGTRPWSKMGDPGDPHSDFIQFYMSDSGDLTDYDWDQVVIERNIFIDGNSRGNVQGMIIADNPYIVANSRASAYARWRVVGNLIVSKIAGMGINIVVPRDCYVANNTLAFWDTTDPENGSAKYITLSRTLDVSPSGPFAYGNSLIKDNISESVVRGVLDNAVINSVGNVVMGLNGTTIPYGDVFTNHTGTRVTRSDAIAAYSPKLAYAGKGAVGNTSYIDHINQTTNRSLEPSYVAWPSLINQSVSTLITSEWGCVISGQDGRAVSISNGEYRIADDENGTNAGAWTSSPGTVDVWKYIQLRHTTSASGSTQTTTTLTIGGTDLTWTTTTQSTSVFSVVDNDAVTYSAITRPGQETGIRKFAFVFRTSNNTIVQNANIFSHTIASPFRLYFPTTGAYRFICLISVRVNLRPTLVPQIGVMKTHFITLDFSNPNANQGCFWATDVDGVLLNNTPGATGFFDTRSVVGTGSDYGAFSADLLATQGFFGNSGSIGVFAEADGGGIKHDGECEFIWMDWGDINYELPDITNPTVRNMWTADLIGADGSGPTGSQPKIYYTGDAAAWNDAGGLANRGSLASLPLVKQDGTYV